MQPAFPLSHHSLTALIFRAPFRQHFPCPSPLILSGKCRLPLLNTLPMNRLLFGDNLGWLRDNKEFPDASVDLVYLNPPFNSNADYNVLFREESGEASLAQFHSFTDTWTWADAADSPA